MPDRPPAPTQRAVFLSYASQDAEAVERIAVALRAAGVEVWFDKSELTGGDAWDAKIRGQIASCALFVPIISANTQARGEGYFRLEWKLAVDRSHLIAHDQPFLLPIVIDATKDSEARVPPEFRAVQWSRLPGGETSPALVGRVKTLLGDRSGPAEARGGARLAHRHDERPAAAAPLPRKRSRLLVGAGVFALSLAALAAVFWWRRPSGENSASADRRFLAVLPFANLSTDPDGAQFTDGMHDEVITALGKVSALTVIGRTSVLPYADPKSRHLRRISAELGIGTVVEGTVRRAGNKVRIAVQLTAVENGRQLWGDVYERELTDVFAIQASIAQDIAAKLDATLTAGERAQLARKPLVNLRAYELYLHAKLLVVSLTQAGTQRAEWDRVVGLLETAVGLEPGFVEGYAQLSRVHSQMNNSPELDPSDARRKLAAAALAQAQALAPQQAETLAAGAVYHARVDHDYAEAERLFSAALALLPNDFELLYLRGLNLRRFGRFQESSELLERSLVLDPAQQPERWGAYLASFLFLRRYAKMVEVGERQLTLRPDLAKNYTLMRFLALARYEVTGEKARLLSDLRSLPSAPDNPDNIVGRYLAEFLGGDLGAARALLDRSGLAPTRIVIIDTNPLQPLGLEQSMIAWLQGDLPAAAAYAESLRAFLQDPGWKGNVYFNSLGQRIRAAAYSGNPAEIHRLAAQLQREIAGKDANTELGELLRMGRVFALVGEKEAALEILKRLFTGPSHTAFPGSPRLIRLDPCWSRLATDPRFDEILRNAKPL